MRSRARPRRRGIKVLGRDQLNPKEADYTTILTKIKALNPDALYYGGVAQAGVKVAKQSYDILPKIIKGGGDGMHSADVEGRRLPGGGGLVRDDRRADMCSTIPTSSRGPRSFRPRNTAGPPEDYSITAYDAALVILDAIKRVAAAGKEVNRDNCARRDPDQPSSRPCRARSASTRTATSPTASSACSRSPRTTNIRSTTRSTNTNTSASPRPATDHLLEALRPSYSPACGVGCRRD